MRDMALKLPQYFYQLIEKPLGCYSQALSPDDQVVWCNQKIPISVSSW